MTITTNALRPTNAGTEFTTSTSVGPVAMTKPQAMGNRLWKPMAALAATGIAVSLALAIARSTALAAVTPDIEQIEALRHLIPGFLFVGFAGVFSAISFAIARILGVFREGGSQLQDDVGRSIKSLKMPATGKAFIGLTMMGMMTVLAGAIIHLVVGFSLGSSEEAELLTSERWFLFAEGLRRLGVGIHLVAISLGLVTILSVIRYQAVRIRQLT